MQDNRKRVFVSEARHIYRKFALDERKISGTKIVLAGDDIMRFLRGYNEVIMLAATLGFEVDRQIVLAQKISVAAALDLDRTANRAINEVCDNIQAEIAKKFNITKHRYSCGYGDFPLDIQPAILNELDARKLIGLYCNESNLMVPTKSITAFLGVKR